MDDGRRTYLLLILGDTEMLELGNPAAHPRTGRVPRFDGKTVRIHGTDIILPPWNLKTARAGCEARRIVREAQTGGKLDPDSDEAISATRHIVTITLQMNYPEVTEEYVDEEVRLQDIRKLAGTILELATVGTDY